MLVAYILKIENPRDIHNFYSHKLIIESNEKNAVDE